MTGRTRAYDHAVAAIEEAPFFGGGQWADRMIIQEHVHNPFLQALLNGGIFGGIPYLLHGSPAGCSSLNSRQGAQGCWWRTAFTCLSAAQS